MSCAVDVSATGVGIVVGIALSWLGMGPKLPLPDKDEFAIPWADPWVKTSVDGGGATVDAGGPTGAESIFPKPMRTGAVSDRAAT